MAYKSSNNPNNNSSSDTTATKPQDDMTFNRTRFSCALTFSVDNSGIQQISGQQYNSKSDLKICCNKKITAKSMQVDITKKNADCCLRKGDVCYTNGLRPCSEFFCFHKFNSSRPLTVPNTAKDSFINQDKCPPPPKSIDKGNINMNMYPSSKRLVALYDTRKTCADKSKPFLIGFHYLVLDRTGAKKPKQPKFFIQKERFRWCCSENIFDDFSLDPQTVCCGLVGSSAPNYAPGKLVNVHNPPCCRKLGGRPLCEPKLPKDKDGISKFNQECPPLSGDVTTKDLSEDIPLFAPQYYGIEISFKDTDLIYAQTVCTTRYFRGKVFSGYGNVDYYNILKIPISNVTSDESKKFFGLGKRNIFSLCCNDKDVFFMNKNEILKSCCYVVNYPQYLQKNIPCDVKGKIDGNFYAFRTCNPKACVKSKFIPVLYNYTQQIDLHKIDFLYGVDKYYEPRYIKK